MAKSSESSFRRDAETGRRGDRYPFICARFKPACRKDETAKGPPASLCEALWTGSNPPSVATATYGAAGGDAERVVYSPIPRFDKPRAR